MKIWRILKLLYNQAVQLDKQQQQEALESTKHNLHLCLKHKQEKNQSHYSEHNCDYCNLENQLAQPTGSSDEYIATHQVFQHTLIDGFVPPESITRAKQMLLLKLSNKIAVDKEPTTSGVKLIARIQIPTNDSEGD